MKTFKIQINNDVINPNNGYQKISSKNDKT